LTKSIREDKFIKLNEDSMGIVFLSDIIRNAR